MSVTVAVDWNVMEPGIELDVPPDVWGALDEVHVSDLTAGVVYGVRFALDFANALPCEVTITNIVVDSTANPTVVAAAAAHAIFQAIEFSPPGELCDKIEVAVRGSRDLPDGMVALFG